MNPEEEKIIWDRKLFWKVMKWVGIFLFSFYLLLILLSYFGPDIQSYLNKKTAENYFERIEKEEKRFIELAKVDTFGGKTPEETLDLYIEALKKGDVELASRYYRVDQLEDALSDLNKAKQKDNLAFAIASAIDLRNKGKKTCFKDGCYIVYEYVNPEDEILSIEGSDDTITIPKGRIREKSVSFELNPDTNVWKIVEP